MTAIRGVPGAVDNVGASYHNLIEDDRALIWDQFGRRQGVLTGLAMSLDAGSLSVTFTPGSAVIEERGTDITGNGRGYHANAATNTVVPFDVPSAASRNDALVVAWADPQYGALGASVSGPGPQIVVVKGVSGSTTPRTDAEIQTAIGPGGWFRYADVIIAPGDTQVNPANVTANTAVAARAEVGAELLRATGSATAPSTTPVNVAGINGLTFTLPEARKVRVEVYAVTCTGASGGELGRLTCGLNGSTFRCQFSISAAGASGEISKSLGQSFDAVAGLNTITLTLLRVTGGTSVTASSIQLVVTDAGPV